MEPCVPDCLPGIVVSGLSRTVTIGDVTEVQNYRLEHERSWTLEVVNDQGASTIWDTSFDTDEEAFAAFELTVEVEGFSKRDNVIPFPRRH
jgi:hypothetical protein